MSEAEIKQLRDLGLSVSVFVHPVRTPDEIEGAIPTLREHHPSEPVWVEAAPEACNPRSSDIGQAFLWREHIVGVNHQHNDSVQVVSGPHEGERGCLVSLVYLEPEPTFILEADSGTDIYVMQSSIIGRTDA